MNVVAGPRAPSSDAPIPGFAVKPTDAVSTKDNKGPFTKQVLATPLLLKKVFT